MSPLKIEPEWLLEDDLLLLHAESLMQFGGGAGLRDSVLLRSALDRPRNRFAYGAADTLTHLAAAYAFGIAKNHPFVDGNKRTALASIRAFLRLNGTRFYPPAGEAAPVIERLASGEVTEEGLAAWIAEHSGPLR